MQSILAFENYYVEPESEYGIPMELVKEREKTNYALTVSVYNDGTLHLDLMYDPARYKEDEAERMLEMFYQLCIGMAENPEGKVEDLYKLTDLEREKILKQFNNTDSFYQSNRTMAGMFTEMARKHKGRPAILHRGKVLTYGELDRMTSALAGRLVSMGVGPEVCVAVVGKKSAWAVAGMLSVLKAGGAYVPLDPEYPEERVRFILDDCRISIVLADGAGMGLSAACSGREVIDLTEEKAWAWEGVCPDTGAGPENLAYVIYTSGTTGRPKGVLLENRGVSAMQAYLSELYEVTGEDRVLQFANYVFDASVWELTMSLLSGATLCIPEPDEIVDPERFREYLEREKISLALLPPQYYLEVDTKGLRVVTTGGSASTSRVVEKARGNERYINAYGPTENTVLATHWEDDRTAGVPQSIPIGKPISNSRIYILEAGKETLCGIGQPGELCIGGAGVARGYLNQPELTEEPVQERRPGKVAA